MTSTIDNFSLEAFEDAAYARRHEEAAKLLLVLLDALNRQYGALREQFSLRISALMDVAELDSHILTRLSSAITCLFSDSSFHLSDQGYSQMIHCQRWLSAIFAASPFKNTDHIIRLLNLGRLDSGELKLDARSLLKFCMLYSPESEIPINLNAIWEFDKELAAGLAFVLMSPRLLATPAAHGKREVILKWLPARLDALQDLDFLPVGILHDVYMHCSYADLPGRHDIKAPINWLIRKKITQLPLVDIDVGASPRKLVNNKPVMLVVLEWFTSEHSIYRTHSRSLEGARQNFYLIGVGDPSTVDAAGRAVFDEFITFQAADVIASLRKVREVAEKFLPSVLYLPSVGMFPVTLFITNLRIAPLQIVALGHPATTRSAFVDYVVVEEDYIGDPACFSEKLCVLPKHGMPYRPSAAFKASVPVIRGKPDSVSVAVAASLMKLNPNFLSACKAIAEKSSVPLQFHFLLGFAQGFVFLQAKNLIKLYLPDAIVYPHQPYADYMTIISRCDMYINPFPFGNTNGIIDMTHHGLAGVCKRGPEVFEHIDAGLFRRLQLPEKLIAQSVEDYIAAAVELAENHAFRLSLRRHLIEKPMLEHIFNGDQHLLGNTLASLLKERS